MSVKIKDVAADSPAAKKGVAPGDTLAEINGNAINDVLDYRFYLTEKKLNILIEKPGGKKKRIRIRKDEADDIGLGFETYLMDKQHSCKNKCIFCFIDQLPPGLRESLYFKDDDSRLSFLFGNYVTLTNLDDGEVDRIIKMHISPVNISVHTMNPELRVKMMLNPRAGECLKYIKRFTDSGIEVNAQLVLCPGINDGPELEFSLRELFRLGENIKSIACVPVGITKYREKLPELRSYDKESAGEVIDTIDRLNAENASRGGAAAAYAADEFYLYAQRPMPQSGYYNDFPQLENGVGMWTLLRDEFFEALGRCTVTGLNREATAVTGTAAFPLISELAAAAQDKIPGLKINVYAVTNRLFGESITVSGLITGADIIAAVEGRPLGEELIIPPNCLRSEGDMFLDNMTVEQLSEKLGGIKVTQNGPSGDGLLASFLGENG